jgi:wobble nucleotide-excising tRNase
MIESMHIAGIATYGSTPEVLNGLSKFNFLYGPNGVGKTAISKVIADPDRFPTCKLTWKGGTTLQPMVYNRDFVARNFNQSAELKGIFTLGEKNVNTLEKIATAKSDIDTLTKKIESLSKDLQGEAGSGGKKGELATAESEFKDKCWALKQKYDARFSVAFEGLRNNAEKFKGRVLKERADNSAELVALADLEKKAETIFGQTPTMEILIPDLDLSGLLAHELNPIFKKRVVGKTDVDIAAMIQKLGNSDWVREGRAFYAVNENQCPFCQQKTTESLSNSLNEYFDETFEKDSKAIEELETKYKIDIFGLHQWLDMILSNPPKFLDVEKLKEEKAVVDSRISLNIQRIATKRKEPSQSIELESFALVLATIKGMLAAANLQITAHNKMVTNLAQERRDLTAQVWKCLIETDLKLDLTTYETKQKGLSKAIDSITEQIASKIGEKSTKAEELRMLEKNITSIQPTIDAINPLLSSFGFRGFSLAKAANGTCYKLVRADGTDAKETLSEGEKTFITFLYFYHLLKGSDSESGITNDRVVVFDDPISSLDSGILFIVGILIKGLFDEVRSGVGHIKQIFVLTHNVYFHKEVTFNPKRVQDAMKEETFWTIKKTDLVSKIQKHNSNPIKTSYELLWTEVREPDHSKLTIQNTLRRILENYFKILGGVDPDKLCAMFEGNERLICKSLFSWVNDGSHSAHDDIYMSIDDTMVETYLSVFRAIFEKSGHPAHYKMMMGDAYVEK